MAARRTRGDAGNRWLIPAVILFVVLPVGGAIASAFLGGDDGEATEASRLRNDRSGSVSLGVEPVPLLPERAPETYAIVYLVTDTATDEVNRSHEELQVRRPFDARAITRDGHDVGRGAVRSQRVSRLTKLAISSTGGQWTLFDIPPALATGDVRFGPALDQALADDQVEVRERRRVAGRECQVFRAGSSLQAGILSPYTKGAASFADVCVDEDGLVLEEVWTLNGKRVQRRVATEVQTDVDLRDERFALPDNPRTIPARDGGGSARPVDPASRPPGAFRVLPDTDVPDGFTLAGRWAVVSPRLDVMRDPLSTGQPNSTSSLVDVYTRGADVLVVDRGAVTGTGALPEAEAAQPVELGALGLGVAITDFRMNEVRSQAGADFVRVYGTLPIPLLIEAARALTVVEGGELRYLDE